LLLVQCFEELFDRSVDVRLVVQGHGWGEGVGDGTSEAIVPGFVCDGDEAVDFFAVGDADLDFVGVGLL
jgi:hypothetical protein